MEQNNSYTKYLKEEISKYQKEHQLLITTLELKTQKLLQAKHQVNKKNTLLHTTTTINEKVMLRYDCTEICNMIQQLKTKINICRQELIKSIFCSSPFGVFCIECMKPLQSTVTKQITDKMINNHIDRHHATFKPYPLPRRFLIHLATELTNNTQRLQHKKELFISKNEVGEMIIFYKNYCPVHKKFYTVNDKRHKCASSCPVIQIETYFTTCKRYVCTTVLSEHETDNNILLPNNESEIEKEDEVISHEEHLNVDINHDNEERVIGNHALSSNEYGVFTTTTDITKTKIETLMNAIESILDEQNPTLNKQKRNPNRKVFNLKWSFVLGFTTNTRGLNGFKFPHNFLPEFGVNIKPIEDRGWKDWQMQLWKYCKDLISIIDKDYADGEYVVSCSCMNHHSHYVRYHKDKNDISHQYAMALGKFRNAKLRIYDTKDVVIDDFNYHRRILKMDGRHGHEVISKNFKGTRYCIIWFKSYDHRKLMKDEELQKIEYVY